MKTAAWTITIVIAAIGAAACWAGRDESPLGDLGAILIGFSLMAAYLATNLEGIGNS